MALTIDQKIEVLDFLHPNVPRTVINGDTLVWDENNHAPMTDSEMEQSYNYVRLKNAISQKIKEIDAVRNEKMNSGMPYSFNGVIDNVQTREQDKFNLLAIAVKSMVLGHPDLSQLLTSIDNISANITFRAESDAEYVMTPDESLKMSIMGYLYLEEIYKRSWRLKDLVLNSNNIEFINSIHWDMEL